MSGGYPWSSYRVLAYGRWGPSWFDPRLVLSTGQSCTEICFQAGHNNQSHFARTFKWHVGTTPRPFRVRNRRGELSAEET